MGSGGGYLEKSNKIDLISILAKKTVLSCEKPHIALRSGTNELPQFSHKMIKNAVMRFSYKLKELRGFYCYNNQKNNQYGPAGHLFFNIRKARILTRKAVEGLGTI